MPVGGCVLFAVASLVSFFSFVTFSLPAHSRPRFRRAASRRCLRGPRCGPCSELGVRTVSPSNGQNPRESARGAFPARTSALLSAGRVQWESSLSDRIANSDPFWARACILSKAFWADKGQNSLFLGKSRFQWAGRPKGVPLEVSGPPERNATGSWRAARKECPLEGGQAKTDRTPKTPRKVAG